MKAFAKQAIRGEQGQALILALILLLVSGLMIAPLLSFMGTGLRTGEVYETRTDELYAADAGVEDAIWRIRDGGGNVSQSPFSIGKINDKNVVVSVRPDHDETRTQGCNTTRTRRFRVESIATGADGGTNVTAYVEYITVSANYSGITDHVITSLGPINTFGQVVINPPLGSNHPNAPEDYYNPALWPPVPLLKNFYWNQVKNGNVYNSPIDLNGADRTLQAGYVTAPLTIHNSDNKREATLTLNGTLYIAGNASYTKIAYNLPNNQDMVLDLNRQTIFVECDYRKPPQPEQALQIGDKCTIKGPGVIVAVGDIYFAPKGQAGGNHTPIFIVSVLGDTYIKPGGDFWGCIAGNVTVDVFSGGGQIRYPQTGFPALNFPGLSAGPVVSERWGIITWEAKPA